VAWLRRSFPTFRGEPGPGRRQATGRPLRVGKINTVNSSTSSRAGGIPARRRRQSRTVGTVVTWMFRRPAMTTVPADRHRRDGIAGSDRAGNVNLNRKGVEPVANPAGRHVISTDPGARHGDPEGSALTLNVGRPRAQLPPRHPPRPGRHRPRPRHRTEHDDATDHDTGTHPTATAPPTTAAPAVTTTAAPSTTAAPAATTTAAPAATTTSPATTGAAATNSPSARLGGHPMGGTNGEGGTGAGDGAQAPSRPQVTSQFAKRRCRRP